MNSVLSLVLLFQLATAAPAPKLAWKQVGSQTFALNATEHRYFRLNGGRWRFDFQADTPIYTGVLTGQQFAAKNRSYLALADFNQFHCVRTNIYEASAQCNINVPSAFLVIRDKRGPLSGLVGTVEGIEAAASLMHPLAAGAAGSFAKGANEKTKDNKIKVTAYRLVCVENCPTAR